MAKVAITEQYLEDIADAIRAKTGSSDVYYPSEMAEAISHISGGGGIIPSGTINITENGTHNVYNYASANVSVASTINNQNKVVTPSASQQTVTADAGYTGLGTVTVNGDSDLVAGNIKKNVQIFGVTGTYEGGGGTPTISSLTVTPSTSEQVFNSSSVDGYKPVTVSAVPTASFFSGATTEYSGNYFMITPYTELNTSLGDVEGYISEGHWDSEEPLLYLFVPSNTSITPTESRQTIGGSNYMMQGAVTVEAISSTYVGSGITRRSSTDLTVSGATVTAPFGYYANNATKSISVGSATGPSSLSGTSATVSTGTNTITLTKTGVSTTPTVSAGYVLSATSSTATVALTANVTTKAAATITPGTTNQTIASGTYLTGTQTISGDANLVAGNIKKDTSIFGVIGTYEGSGGGSGLTVDTATATLSSAAASIAFTGLAGEPTSFAVVSAADLATGASPWKTAAVVFDGTSLHGQTIRNTSNAQVTYDSTDFSKSYSSGTLTITGSGTNFQANQYKLVYTYGGSDIGTADVQVGSGATSVTFTGLEEEPSYFSCIFKSNFSTSSGYQRVIVVVYDGTSTYGMEMDSSAKYSGAHWTYSYNSGSLTITSSGTNAGGYFHQPGYYQLTYAVEGSSGNYQAKSVTYYATNSQQTATVTADSGYDALKKVDITIPAVTTTNLTASNIINGVTIQVGDSADSDRIASVTGNVVLQNYYTGSSAPSSATGSNGDLYLQS